MVIYIYIYIYILLDSPARNSTVKHLNRFTLTLICIVCEAGSGMKFIARLLVIVVGLPPLLPLLLLLLLLTVPVPVNSIVYCVVCGNSSEPYGASAHCCSDLFTRELGKEVEQCRGETCYRQDIRSPSGTTR